MSSSMTVDGITFRDTGNPYIAFDVTIEDRVYFIPDSAQWWSRIVFLSQFEDGHVKMKTVSDFLEWYKKAIEVFNQDGLRSRVRWMKEYTRYMFNVSLDGFQSASSKYDTINVTLRDGVDPDYELFQWEEAEPGDYASGGAGNTSVLLPAPTDDLPEVHSYRVVDRYQDNHMAVHIMLAERPSIAGFEGYHFSLKNYTFKPDPEFMSLPKEKHATFFGMEIEVSTVLGVIELQRIVTEYEPVQEPFFYFKEDSSITGGYQWRYEIVTHPMTPKRMKKEWRTLFKKLDKLCEEKGFKREDIFDMSEDLNNGIHIHVSNNAFILPHRGVRSFHKNRFLTAFNQWDSSFQEWLKLVTKRRRVGRSSEYYPPHPGMEGKTLARRLMRGQDYSEHRSACHDGGATTEVRVFYGLFDLKHILSCIELVEAMLEFTANSAPRTCFGRMFVPKFTGFVKRQPGLRYAKEVLKACA